MTVSVSPEEFHLVKYDAQEIVAIVSELADRVGLGERDIVIEVDEKTPLGSSAVVSLDPITITVESGAFEDAKHLRHLARDGVEGGARRPPPSAAHPPARPKVRRPARRRRPPDRAVHGVGHLRRRPPRTPRLPEP